MKASLKSVRISPKKVNLVADMVRGKGAAWAIDFLSFTPKRSAKPLMETIKSAVANAQQNFKQQKKDLYIKSIVINEGPTIKRFRPVSRGRSHPLRKRTTRIHVEVAVRAPTEKSGISRKVERKSSE